jgi:hypothetical protein
VKILATIASVFLLLVTVPYFIGGTGPHTIACNYDRIGRSTLRMLAFQFGSAPITAHSVEEFHEQITRVNAGDSNCR